MISANVDILVLRKAISNYYAYEKSIKEREIELKKSFRNKITIDFYYFLRSIGLAKRLGTFCMFLYDTNKEVSDLLCDKEKLCGGELGYFDDKHDIKKAKWVTSMSLVMNLKEVLCERDLVLFAYSWNEELEKSTNKTLWSA
ncbi:hypothetical protein [uncultured Alteromonas sp.]|uniref:hypothetical protein n=1 Tax=uncultured Alteromonas sp. TaxID=179113 RepID=UPI0030ED9A02|tara:strand:+ start:298 stop:723 length:426 start_codon:yes stop_codon:yes gene_type:complete